MPKWNWPNARDWIGLGTFSLTIMILWMIKEDQTLRNDEFFKTIATLIIGTGFINGVVSWAYSATKGGTELADKNAAIVHENATAATAAAKIAVENLSGSDPTPVVVTNTEEDPAIVVQAGGDAPPDETLPEYAR